MTISTVQNSGWLRISSPGWAPPAPSEDPFGATEVPSKGVSVREMLEQVGIPFPAGASVLYDAQHSKLIAVNTRANLELIAIYTAVLDGPGSGANKIAIRTEIYEVTTLQALQLLESAAAEGNHAPERNAALGAVREGTARLVATHSLVTTAGQRAKLQDVAEQMVPAAEKPGSKPGEEPPPLLEAREYGTILEVEPNVDADGLHISLNIALEHHTAAPELTSVAGHPDLPKFHVKSVQTNLSLTDAGYLLFATWKPTGKPEYAEGDVTQVVFVNAAIQRAR